MTLTLTGALILIVGVVLFFRSSFDLLLWVLISIPFSATAVFNLGEGESGVGISATLVLVSLYLLRRFLTIIVTGRIRLVGGLPLSWFAVFLGALGFSITTPALNPGLTFIAVDPRGALEATFTLYLGIDHLKNLAYFLVWGLFLFLATPELADLGRLRVVIKTLLYTGIFVSLWGWMQVGSSLLGLPYPYQIFNNTASGVGQGYKQAIEGLGISRMSSVSTEPSVFASYILVLIALLLGFVVIGVPLLGIRRDRWLAAFLALTVLASTASTAYVGLGFLTIITVVALLRTRNNLLIPLIWMLSGLLAFLLVSPLIYWGIPLVQGVVNNFLLTRADSFSFGQRFLSVIYALQSFSNFPIFGLGINSMTVYSMPFWLLANTGIVGLISFYGFYASLFRAPVSFLRRSSNTAWLRGLAMGSVFALLLLLLITALTGFPYIYGYFWLSISIALSVGAFLPKRAKTYESLLSLR